MSVKVIEHLVGLLVGDHALVGALHFVEEDDINIGLGALTEAGRDNKAVEKIRVTLDVLELVGGGSIDEGTPEASVLIAHILFYFINIILNYLQLSYNIHLFPDLVMFHAQFTDVVEASPPPVKGLKGSSKKLKILNQIKANN